ncbi:hypothetical protein ACF0H5_013839 [Mactra antiquata]
MTTDLQNTIKEVDLQIIYRRLEARNRNITQDGRMSKQQIASAYRGYHGLEKQYHALTQMSNQTYMQAKAKNDHIHMKHVEDLKYLIEQEKTTKHKTEHNLKVMRDDFTAQLAYQYVYKTHSFKRYYKSQQQKKVRPASDKPEMYDRERTMSAKNNAPRPLGSLRELELYKDELKLKFPPIKTQDKAHDSKTQSVNAMEGKSYETLKDDAKTNTSTMVAFPNIETAMGVDIKFKPVVKDDDKYSAITAPPAGLYPDSDDDNSAAINKNLVTLDMGQSLLQLRRKEKEMLEQRRVLPATPNTKRREERKESWKRVLPETPKRSPTVYPEEYKMKKHLKKEATDVLEAWARHSKRLDVVEYAKDHHKATLADNPVPTFDRSRPTSAILNEFREYKKLQLEQEALRQASENDHAMIVRQMSPQPRVDSPVAQSRNEFMTASRAVIQRENSHISMHNPGKLKRTESEKFPSVSRTSSYKDVLDFTNELHENALLSAAERIELEKRKRDKVSVTSSHEESNKQKNQKGKTTRRKLPSLPVGKKENPSKCNTTTVSLDHDVTTIQKVKNANDASNGDHIGISRDRQFVKTLGNPNLPSERGSTQSDDKNKPLPVGKSKNSQDAGSLLEKEFWPRMNKTMHFNYENYSRTTPETKRKLEIRAKNRRKIQQRNAQLKEEMRTKKKVKTESEERPPTRVSFNDNVVVFQKI